MIYNKRQLLKMILTESFKSNKIINKVISKIMNMPESEFVSFIDSELHWHLTPIRKNQYLIS